MLGPLRRSFPGNVLPRQHPAWSHLSMWLLDCMSAVFGFTIVAFSDRLPVYFQCAKADVTQQSTEKLVGIYVKVLPYKLSVHVPHSPAAGQAVGNSLVKSNLFFTTTPRDVYTAAVTSPP